MIRADDLINAAKRYDKNKYSEEFYRHHIEVLKNSKTIDESTIQAVKYLFLWKLGKIRTYQTPGGYQLNYIDSTGQKYYGIPTTEANSKAIKNATEKTNLEVALSFRDRKVTYNKFKEIANNITSTTIVLPAFFIHIWLPEEYPILDEKVWKIYCREKKLVIHKYTKPKSWNDFEKYTAFFREIVNNTGLDYRTVDKGLWVLGGEFKSK